VCVYGGGGVAWCICCPGGNTVPGLCICIPACICRGAVVPGRWICIPWVTVFCSGENCPWLCCPCCGCINTGFCTNVPGFCITSWLCTGNLPNCAAPDGALPLCGCTRGACCLDNRGTSIPPGGVIGFGCFRDKVGDATFLPLCTGEVVEGRAAGTRTIFVVS